MPTVSDSCAWGTSAVSSCGNSLILKCHLQGMSFLSGTTAAAAHCFAVQSYKGSQMKWDTDGVEFFHTGADEASGIQIIQRVINMQETTNASVMYRYCSG